MDITIDVDDYELNIRAAGVMIHNGKVLVHKNVNSDYYALIGGRVEKSVVRWSVISSYFLSHFLAYPTTHPSMCVYCVVIIQMRVYPSVFVYDKLLQ